MVIDGRADCVLEFCNKTRSDKIGMGRNVRKEPAISVKFGDVNSVENF